MKTHPVGAKLFHADGRTDKGSIGFSQFYESAWTTVRSDEAAQVHVLEKTTVAGRTQVFGSDL
jgi:hypothetical protein